MSLILAMDPHDPHHQESGSGFHNPAAHWGDANSPFTSHHQSPVNEYNSYSFSPVTMEPMFASSAAMPPPRTTSTHQQLQQLQPLIMPAPPWPSMLASQSTYAQPIYSATTMSCSPQALRTPSTPLSAPPTTGRQSNPRKTLTDADRKRMCLYAEEHPNVKQTEIGAMFGVERSTVSKVLRNKEKYLYQDDGSRSPVRKQKGKFPDIERALSNWAKNAQRNGITITDALIKEKFKFFATTVGNNESLPKVSNSSWLEKFKQKNALPGGKSRKSSMVEDPETASNPVSAVMTPSDVSPTSPSIGKELSPASISATKAENIKEEGSDAFADYSLAHKPYHSLSTESLASEYTHSQSPASPFFASESASPFLSQAQPRAPPASSNFHRPRSQTFPVGVDPYVSPPCSEPLTPKYMPNATALEVSLAELPPAMSCIDDGSAVMPIATMRPPPPPPQSLAETLPHSLQTSPPALHGLPLQHSSPMTPSSAISVAAPGSPTIEDTRQALEVVIQYIQHQPSEVFNTSELMLMGGIMAKLNLSPHHQYQARSPVTVGASISRGAEMPGGMHRIATSEFK